MNSIESQFVPYSLAVKLKEFGMELDAYFGGYTESKQWQWHPDSDIVLDVPIYGQAFDWFRVEHGLHYIIEFSDVHSGYSGLVYSSTYDLLQVELQRMSIPPSDHYRHMDYESARLSCLEKLIELVTLNRDNNE